jgi:hypothetical protein
MKLFELSEMTMRTGQSMDKHIPNFTETIPYINHTKQYVGKMQNLYSVYSYTYNNTQIYAAYDGDEWVGFVQYKIIDVPNYGTVLNTLNTKVNSKYRGNKFSLQLRLFVSLHLGLNQLVGSVISNSTEALIPYMTRHFDTKLINTKTGEIRSYSRELFVQLSSIAGPTNWQILLQGSDNPTVNEEAHLGYMGEAYEDVHIWALADFFEDVVD